MKIFVQLLSVLILSSCLTNTKAVPLENEGLFTEVTVVKDDTMDGCGFMLEGLKGQLYNPINLKDVFHKKGLKLSIQYVDAKPVPNVCMTGKLIRLTKVHLSKGSE